MKTFDIDTSSEALADDITDLSPDPDVRLALHIVASQHAALPERAPEKALHTRRVTTKAGAELVVRLK